MKLTERFSCRHCGGSGYVDAPSPHLLRRARENAGLSLREVARRLKMTAPYISDVELGRRNVSAKMLGFYQKLK